MPIRLSPYLPFVSPDLLPGFYWQKKQLVEHVAQILDLQAAITARIQEVWSSEHQTSPSVKPQFKSLTKPDKLRFFKPETPKKKALYAHRIDHQSRKSGVKRLEMIDANDQVIQMTPEEEEILKTLIGSAQVLELKKLLSKKIVTGPAMSLSADHFYRWMSIAMVASLTAIAAVSTIIALSASPKPSPGGQRPEGVSPAPASPK